MHQSTWEIYKGCQAKKPKKRVAELTLFYYETYQSTKSIKDIDASIMQCLRHSKKLYIKMDLNACSTFWNTLLFLSHQIVQKNTKGHSSMPSYASSQCRTHSRLTNISLVEVCITHSMLNTEMTNCHNILAESPNVKKYDQHSVLPFYICNFCFLRANLSFSTGPKSKSFPM